MATPHAVCAIAILKSYNPNCSMKEITDELKKYAVDLGEDGWDDKFGYGFINFNSAPFEELGEGKLFSEVSEDYSIVKKIEPTSNYIAKNNYGTISNILEANINIYYSNTDYYTKALGELEGLEVLNYEPYTYTIQKVTLKYKGQECVLSVDNTSNTTSAWQYEIIDDENRNISITKWNPIGTVNLKKLYIPSELDGYTVKKIGQDVFNQNKIIYYYYLPNSIDIIGKNAFSASSIIELNSKAETVGVEESAFRLCYSLRKFEPKLSSVGRSAFYNALKLESVSFSDSIGTISESAFFVCESLKSINLPETITKIGDYAFNGCKNIESICIPKNVNSIGIYAFGYMDNIKSISVDSNNLIYDSRNNCNAIIETATDTLIQGYSITNIPSSVKIIGTNSFNGALFKEITIPEGVERIENKAFYYSVWNLEKVILPNSINYIDSDAFRYVSYSNNPVFWVYRNSYTETFIKTTEFSYLYRDDNVYDIEVELAKTYYYALDEINLDDISISLIYNNDNVIHETYLGDVYITYNNNDENMRLNYGDEYVTIGILDGTRKVTKNVSINISKLVPNYEIPQNLIGKTNTLLSSILLPDNFEWMNPNQLITQTGNQSFKAKYIPEDCKNYKTVENIDINVSISEGKKIIVPNISIQDKEYDGTTSIDFNSIIISNLNDNEYTIQNVFLLSPEVGNKKASVRLKLTNDKYADFTFDNGKSEKTFVENIKINKAVPTFEIPQNISANIGQELSEIALPNGFEWMERNTIIDKIGNITYKAKYIPADTYNYEIVDNIDIIISVVNPRKVIVPNITINDKIYDGMTTLNNDYINIYNLQTTEYDIISAIISSADVGERTATIKLRLANEKYEEYSFDNGKQEKEFEIEINVLPLELVKPTLVEKEYVYNGTVQTIELNNFDEDKMNISGNSRTNVGEQTTTISLKSNNYIWNDRTRNNIEFTFKINKANSNIQYSVSNLIHKYDGQFYGIELELQSPTNAIIKYANKNDEYVLDEMPKYNEIGTYTIKYRIYINDNYTDIYGENTLAIVENFVLGDINEDGKVNIKDWNRLFNHINETEQLTGTQLLCADLNGDGKVNIKDWNRMYDHITEVNPLW